MNKSETLNQAQIIQSLNASDVIRNEYVHQQFISVYNAIWKEGGEAAYERESIYFIRQLRDNDKLRKCTGMSVFFAFIDLAVRGLTLEPGVQALCYLLPRSFRISTPQGDRWESRCNLTISGYGELVLRAKAGQIHHADNPVIVYEGDEFSFGEKDGRKYVNYCCRLPRTSDRIVACFIKITRCDGTVDYSVMYESDWKRLEGYSAKNNTYFDKQQNRQVSAPNALYSVNGQIDTGFLMAKCIKHAFKTYPKIAIGKGTQLESDVVEQPQSDFGPYGGISEGDRPKCQEEPKPFGPSPDMSAGVTGIPDADSDYSF